MASFPPKQIEKASYESADTIGQKVKNTGSATRNKGLMKLIGDAVDKATAHRHQYNPFKVAFCRGSIE